MRPMAEQLVASLLERERSVLAPLAERWWKRDLRRLLEQKAEERDCRIVALEIMPAHACPDQVMFRLKSSSSHTLRRRYPELLRFPSLWTRSYFCSTLEMFQTQPLRDILRNRKTKIEEPIHPTTKAVDFLGSLYINMP